MRGTLLALSLVTLVVISLSTTPAKADCTVDIRAVEQHLAALSGKEKQRGPNKKAQDLVNKAKDALAEGKIMRCEKLAKKAREKIE